MAGDAGEKQQQLRRAFFGDFYHAFLRLPWWAALSGIVGTYLALNACFALAYLDISTGEFRISTCDRNGLPAEVEGLTRVHQRA